MISQNRGDGRRYKINNGVAGRKETPLSSPVKWRMTLQSAVVVVGICYTRYVVKSQVGSKDLE